MTDMRSDWLPHGADEDHNAWTLRVRVAHCPPPPVARALSNPSWKVIVSASHGQYLEAGLYRARLFFARSSFGTPRMRAVRQIDRGDSLTGWSSRIIMRACS